MTELALLKTPGGYVPATDQDADICLKHKSGDVIHADFKKMRNSLFHRKFFALLNIGFGAWEPGDINNQYGPAEKNFEQFREDVTILAGYYEQHVRLDGTIRVTAKSISFSNMEQEDFEKVYSAVINVLLARVLTNYAGRADIDRVVDQILGF